MLKVFEKYGKLKCVSGLLDVLGALLVVISFALSGELMSAIRLGGIILLIIGTFTLIFLNIKKETSKVGLVGLGLIALSILLIAISGVVDETKSNLLDADLALKIIGLFSMTVGGLMMSISSKEHRLAKSMLVMAGIMFLFSWILPYGYFQGADFYNYDLNRIGLFDISVAIYNALYYSMDKILFLFMLAGFYGVLSQITGYQKLVTKLADLLQKNTIVTAIVMSVILIAATSLFTQTLVVLIFVPFFVSILYRMKLDKLTVFVVTFGSVLVGILGATFGTESLISYNSYISAELTLGLKYRYIIVFIATILYEFFITMRVKKILTTKGKNTKNAEVDEDPFKVEPTKKKVSLIPAAIFLFIIFVIFVLGYIDWNTNFEIEVFNNFHEWLLDLAPTEDFNIMSYILGQNAFAFGKFKYVFIANSIIGLISIILAYLYKMSISEYLESFYNGVKKIFKPMIYVAGVYFIFAICYNSPVFGTITNWGLNLVQGFNPYLTALMAFVTSAFYNDLGFTSYLVGGFLTTVYTDNIALVNVIYSSMYGIVQLFLPTSVILVIGLSLLKLDYKEWLKYIWLFIVGMLLILLVLFTVVAYI